ncbi:hypothetical protein GJU43_12800 [Flavobacterium sp. LC2016-23]|uniref:hypothetical protein n=1 Tax=Flavobacterium sp. LC2016-23 TaxID=2666330 RepID=UPI0012AF40D2|nr:hypothetical protein [Flavobacterium sp. LC2016-23]MRX40159.1 hypothetical protein [Flavobacterium sp. LC2016-23]
MSKLEKKIQHREFVQNIITRMNANSFQIKSLTITIISAFLAIYATTTKELFLIIPIPIVVLFWFLDTYYLQQERKFKGIYNDITGLNNNPITTNTYQISPNLYIGKEYNYWNAFSSKTLFPFYLLIIVFLLFSYFIIEFNVF